MITIAPAHDLTIVRELITEYANSLGVDLSFLWPGLGSWNWTFSRGGAGTRRELSLNSSVTYTGGALSAQSGSDEQH